MKESDAADCDELVISTSSIVNITDVFISCKRNPAAAIVPKSATLPLQIECATTDTVPH